MTRTHWLHELRWPEIEAYLEHRDLVLVPIGATEQHGRHLPLLVDTGSAVAACEACAEKTEALIAPPLHFGWSPRHMGYPGSITLGADTLRQVSIDICQSLIHHGFHHVVIVNGNRIANLQPLEIAAVQLQNRTGARVAVADTGLIAREEVKALCEAADGGLKHAGEAESSFALHWKPDHVAMSEARPLSANVQSASRFDSPVEIDPALNRNAVSRFSTPAQHRAATLPHGHVGDPTLASPTKGRAMIEAIARNLASFVEEFQTLEVGEVRCDIPT